MAKSSKSKKDEKKNRADARKNSKANGKTGEGFKSDAESDSGQDGAALLSKAKVPAAATGAVLIGAAGAATVKKVREPRSRKGRLLKKAAKPAALVAATGGARRIKRLVTRP